MTSGSFTSTIYDNTVLKSVRALFGGRIKILSTSAAPIHADVLTFFKVALSIHIYEVYGLTEATGAVTFSHPSDPSAGHIGGPIPIVKLRLRDIPELECYHTDRPPKGELQVKGPNCFKGYFRNPKMTAEAFDGEGWVNSGDVAVIYPNGSIQIIDRVKNLFKLAQGVFIAPEKLENIYILAPSVG